MARPDHAEVVIIGGGFAGAATAWELARIGVRDVVVLEREARCGHHASGRGAGLGRQLCEEDEITRFAVRGAARLRRPEPEVSERALIDASGSLLLCDDEGARDALIARAARFAVRCELLDGVAVQRHLEHAGPLLEGVRASCGVFVPDDGVIAVGPLLDGLLRAAAARGVRVLTGCGLEALRSVGGRGEVVAATSAGEIRARCVVDAAGAWAGEVGRLAGSRDTRFLAIRRHLFVSAPTPPRRYGQPFVWHLGARAMYVRPERGGAMWSWCDGVEVEPHDVVATPTALSDMEDAMAERAPALARLPVASYWAGLRTFAPDGRPVLGWDREVPWLYWVAALGGHGATACLAMGEAAAAQIAARLAPGAAPVTTRA